MEESDAMDELAREDVLRKAEKLYRDNGADFVILNLSELPGVLAQIENR